MTVSQLHNIYSNQIFPRLLDWSMAGESLASHRKVVLAEAKGDILEVGFGSGLNLPFYPKSVRHITVIDNNIGMRSIAQKRIQSSDIEVNYQVLTAEKLPMAAASFDTVVSTWTLCSIPDVAGALGEIRRVLRPTGSLLFVEHGLSPDPNIQVWQRRWDPVQRVIGDGCHVTRDIAALIAANGFKLRQIDRFYERDLWKVLGYFYRGIAVVEEAIS